MQTKLSILIPTRNRANYVAAGVNWVLQSSREDIEVIVTDASDEHNSLVENLSQWNTDSRLVVVNNTVAVNGCAPAMIDNWSCALDRARGEWIAIIGDDDILDPAILTFIEKVEKFAPNIGVITWHKCSFDLDVERPREAKIPMGNNIMVAHGRDSVLKQATWPNSKRPPTSIASPYHGCVHRKHLEQIKSQRGGKWFKFVTPDYDLGWSVAWLNEPFLISERPFSIAGVCKSSNSYGVRNDERRAINHRHWLAESRNIDGWGDTNSRFFWSLPMAVLGFRHAFCKSEGIGVGVNTENFVETIRNTLQNQEYEEDFYELKSQASHFLIQAFSTDFGVSKLARLERPPSHFGGLVGDSLVIPYNVFGGNISEFSRVAFQIVRPVEHMFREVAAPRIV